MHKWIVVTSLQQKKDLAFGSTQDYGRAYWFALRVFSGGLHQREEKHREGKG
jgi:hypothetical protein